MAAQMLLVKAETITLLVVQAQLVAAAVSAKMAVTEIKPVDQVGLQS
jgi:hypothetical protein